MLSSHCLQLLVAQGNITTFTCRLIDPHVYWHQCWAPILSAAAGCAGQHQGPLRSQYTPMISLHCWIWWQIIASNTLVWRTYGHSTGVSYFRRESHRPLYSKVIHSKSNFCSMDHKIFVSRCCCICWDLIGYAFCFTTAFDLSTADAYLRRGAVPYVTSLSPAHRCRHWRTLSPTGDRTLQHPILW